MVGHQHYENTRTATYQTEMRRAEVIRDDFPAAGGIEYFLDVNKAIGLADAVKTAFSLFKTRVFVVASFMGALGSGIYSSAGSEMVSQQDSVSSQTASEESSDSRCRSDNDFGYIDTFGDIDAEPRYTIIPGSVKYADSETSRYISLKRYLPEKKPKITKHLARPAIEEF